MNNKAAASKAALPVSIAYVIAAGLLYGMTEIRAALPVFAILIAGFLLEALNVRYSLMRGFTRMISCCYMLFSIASVHVPRSGDMAEITDMQGVFRFFIGENTIFVGMIMLLLFVFYLFFVFQAYQRRQAPALFFFAYVFIGIISLRFVHMLYFVPFLWMMTVIWLQAPSVRNTAAMFMGLLLPYWFWLAWLLYTGNPAVLINHFPALASFEPLCNGILEPHLLVSCAVLTLFHVCGMMRFWYFSYNENIRNRMQHLMIYAVGILALVFLVLQPQHANFLLPLVILGVSVSSAHYFTFSKSKLASVLFVIFIVVVLSATVLNVCNI